MEPDINLKEDQTLQVLLTNPSSLTLWKCIIQFAGHPFTTSGRGSRNGVSFTYTVSHSPSAAGRQYSGESVDGWGNELWISTAAGEKKDKSISRSSVDYALSIVLEKQKADEQVTGPKQLKVYGSSYVYAIFKRFGLV